MNDAARKLTAWTLSALLLACTLASAATVAATNARSSETEYLQLQQLFLDYQQRFRPVDQGEYLSQVSRDTLAAEFAELEAFERQLAALDWQRWSVARQIDYQLVQAEMNGARFAYEVTVPWLRDPGIYADFIRSLTYASRFPLTREESQVLQRGLGQAAAVLGNARGNLSDLTTVPADLGTLAIRSLDESKAALEVIASKLADQHQDLVGPLAEVQSELADFRVWLQQRLPQMRGQAGVGEDSYNWLLKNVYLMPYNWSQLSLMIELEDNRVITFQKLEENHNTGLPALEPVTSQAQYRASVQASIDYLMRFIEEQRIFSIPEYLTPDGYIGSWHNFDAPWPEQHDYFFNFSHRESLMEETHEMVGHHFDELRGANNLHPVRKGWRPHKISTARTEGFAFALEELLMYAGYLDQRPARAREVAYEQAAFRTVRAIADLKMHSGEWTLREAMDYAVANAPHGELLDDSDHLWFEMGTTLRGVGHHALMVIGKVQFMKLLRDAAHQQGDEFSLQQFMDTFFASGLIPYSLIRWEMTGATDEIDQLW